MPKRHVWNSIFDDATSLKNLTVQQCEVRLGRSARRAKMAQKRAALAYFRTGEELILLKAKLAGRKQTRQFQKRAFELTGYDETWVRYLMRAVRKFRYLGPEKQQQIAGLAIRNAIAEIDSFITAEELRRLEAERPIEWRVLPLKDTPPTSGPKPISATRIDADDAVRQIQIGKNIARVTANTGTHYDVPMADRSRIRAWVKEMEEIWAKNDRANADDAEDRPEPPPLEPYSPPTIAEWQAANPRVVARPFSNEERYRFREICRYLGAQLDEIARYDDPTILLQQRVKGAYARMVELFDRRNPIVSADGPIDSAPSIELSALREEAA